jgi:hypothetical protein
VFGEEEPRLLGQIVHGNGVVCRPGREKISDLVQANDTTPVSSHCRHALARPPIPHLDCAVQAACDQSGVIELEAANAEPVAGQCSDLLSGSKIPNFGGRVVGSRDQNLFIELKTHDTIRVPLQHTRGKATVLPVGTDSEPVLVHIFPWALFGLWLIKVRRLLIPYFSAWTFRG